MSETHKRDESGYRKASWKSWIFSPYMLFLGIAVVFIWYITGNAVTHFVPDRPERAVVTFEDEYKAIMPGDTEVTVFPAGKSFEILGRLGNKWILEDPVTSTRFTRVEPERRKERYVLSGDSTALDKVVKKSFITYVKADDVKNLFLGEKISDVVEKYGDYVESNPESGYFYFCQLVPVTGSVRHESGVVFTADADGVITGSDEKDPNLTSSNLFGKLPFFSTIVSWNIFTHGLDSMVSKSKHEEEKGWLALFFGWIWDLVWGICKIGIFVVLCTLLFFLPASAVWAITGPMVRTASISSKTILWINTILAFPLEYIIFISLTDVCHQLWWVMGPLFLMFAAGSIGMLNEGTAGRRCPNCSAIDSHYTESKVLDERTTVSFEERTGKDSKLKYKGYKLKTMSHQWERGVREYTYKVTVTETDYQHDHYCHKCDYHHTSFETQRKKKRELYNVVHAKETYVPKEW